MCQYLIHCMECCRGTLRSYVDQQMPLSIPEHCSQLLSSFRSVPAMFSTRVLAPAAALIALHLIATPLAAQAPCTFVAFSFLGSFV